VGMGWGPGWGVGGWAQDGVLYRMIVSKNNPGLATTQKATSSGQS